MTSWLIDIELTLIFIVTRFLPRFMGEKLIGFGSIFSSYDILTRANNFTQNQHDMNDT